MAAEGAVAGIISSTTKDYYIMEPQYSQILRFMEKYTVAVTDPDTGTVTIRVPSYFG